MPRPLAKPLDERRITRKFWMSPELHAAATEYAHFKRTTMSELIREQLEDIREHPLNTRKMVSYDVGATYSVSVAVDDDLYLGAKDAAYPTRKSVTSLVRRRLLRLLEKEGLWVQDKAA